jgi:transcriptional regulator with XRE-family HTH domain
MKAQEWFKNQIGALENTPTYKAEVLQLKISEKILELLEHRKMTRADLAKELKCSLPYVSKLINGSENMTIKKMVEIAISLKCDLDIKIVPKEYAGRLNLINFSQYKKPIVIDEVSNGENCNLATAV